MNNHRKYIKDKKILYNNIGYIICPALGGEKVYFNSHGFTHLLIKLGKWRGFRTQKNRLDLLKYARLIIEDPKVNITTKASLNKLTTTTFYCLQKNVGSVNTLDIKMILRKIGHGRVHFYSIFEVR